MRKNVNEFWVWCASQKDEFLATWRKSKNLIYNYNEKTGVAVISNLRTGKTASASANIQKTRGIMNVLGLAWASYKGEQIPAFYEPLISFYEKDEVLFRYNCKEWQIIQRHPYDSEKLICACENGEIANFKLQALVRRV